MHRVLYVFDLDGTTYDNSHRAHLIPQERSNTAQWIVFNAACVNDTPRKAMVALAQTLIAAGQDVMFLTGRGEAALDATAKRLLEDGLWGVRLAMRPMDDHRPAAEFKSQCIRHLLEDQDVDIIAFEDDPKIVAALRNIPRVTVLQIDSLGCATGG